MEETYSEFSAKILNRGSRKHRITNSYGVYDAFKFYRKNKPSEKKYVLTESQYFSIIRKIHEKLVAKLMVGEDVKFPGFMGQIEIRKRYVEPRLDSDGKLIFSAPPDWEATLKLWYEQPEARKNKIIIKQENRDVFSLFYSKSKAKYKNKSYIHFKSSRSLRKKLFVAVTSGQIKGCKLLYGHGS